MDDQPSTRTDEVNLRIVLSILKTSFMCLSVWRLHACVVNALVSLTLHASVKNDTRAQAYGILSLFVASFAVIEMELLMDMIVDSNVDLALALEMMLAFCWTLKSADDLIKKVLLKKTPINVALEKSVKCYVEASALSPLLVVTVLREEEYNLQEVAKYKAFICLAFWLLPQVIRKIINFMEGDRADSSKSYAFLLPLFAIRMLLLYFAVMTCITAPWLKLPGTFWYTNIVYFTGLSLVKEASALLQPDGQNQQNNNVMPTEGPVGPNDD